jgi:hypothetical protein
MTREKEEEIAEVLETWEQLDQKIGTAEAKLRILLKQVEPPKLAEEPQWLIDELDPIRQFSGGLYSTGYARNLVLACLARNSILRPTIDVGPLISVDITWGTGTSKLRWVVRASELRWPGISVNALMRVGEGKDAVREYRVLHYAGQALAQFDALIGTLAS